MTYGTAGSEINLCGRASDCIFYQLYFICHV